MNEDKSEIENLYKEIGKIVYEKHNLQDTIYIKEELEEECTKIDVLSDEIENTLKEIMSLRDLKQCPNCYEQIDKSAFYCPNCGRQLPDNAVYCDGCGLRLDTVRQNTPAGPVPAQQSNYANAYVFYIADATGDSGNSGNANNSGDSGNTGGGN